MLDMFLNETADIFLKIVNMSISAGWIVLIVLLLRCLLKKAPKWITVLLWGIVAVRLICPFSIESILSLIPSAETVSPGIMNQAIPHINTGVPAINSTVNPVIGSAFSPEAGASANPLQILIPVWAVIWLLGIAGMLIYTAVSYFTVKRKIGTAVLLRENIYQSENIPSPFVLGIIKPKIYLPFYIKEKDISHVIAHEKAHLLRKDHLWKPLGFLILSVHWFNPLVWLGYVLLCRDIELACDEKVVKTLSNEQRADYSEALLTCSVNRRMIAACPLAFGEVGVKDRVKSILNYKKPAFWVIVVSVILCVALAIGFLTNPVNLYVYNSRYETGKCLFNYVVSADKETKNNELVFDITSDGKVYKSYPDGMTDDLGVLTESDYTAEDLKEAMKSQGEKLNIGKIESAYEFSDYILLQKNNGAVYLVSLFTDGRIMSVFKLERTGECDSSKSDFEKFTWNYSPMLSHTSYSFYAFAFDTGYSHIVASCDNGKMKNLEADKQPEDKTLRFEKGQHVYWTPDDAVTENIPNTSKVTFTVFDGGKAKYTVSVVFECIYRDLASAVFEIYLAESDGLYLSEKDGLLYFAESVSSVNDFTEKILGSEYPEKYQAIHYSTEEEYEATHPEKDNNTHGGIHLGEVYAEDLIEYLNARQWKSCSAPWSDLSSPGSVEFVISDDCRISVYQKKNIFSRAYAVVKKNGEETYYKAKADDYSDAKSILRAIENTKTEYEATVSYANWAEVSELYSGALNSNKMYISSVQHLPVYKFDSLEDFEGFKNAFADKLTMDSGWDEVPSFNDATAKYDKAFFEENTLMLVYVSANNSTHRFAVNSVYCENNSLCIHIEETTKAEMTDCAMAGWFVTVAVSDEDIVNVTQFDADLNNIAGTDTNKLRLKYPQFFDVSTDGGLTVYVWQMAENNYRCHLANTALEALSDNSFIYTTGATIEEMKLILSTYDIDREDITIQPITNPISSYYYVIDEAYSAKLKELFWGDTAVIYPVYDGKRIPKLTVFCGAVKTEAVTGTLTWTCEAENGTMQTINADSSHPTALMEHLLPLALNINTSPENEPVAKLHFDNPPNKISVKGWYVYGNEKTKEFDVQTEGLNVLLNDTKETAVYEIVAEWNGSAKYYGTVRYSFCVVPSANDYEAYIQYGNNDQYIFIHKDTAFGSFENPYKVGDTVRLRHSDTIAASQSNIFEVYDYNVTLENVISGEEAKNLLTQNCTNLDECAQFLEKNDVYLVKIKLDINEESDIKEHFPINYFVNAIGSDGKYIPIESILEYSQYPLDDGWVPVFAPKGEKVKLGFWLGEWLAAPGQLATVYFDMGKENGEYVRYGNAYQYVYVHKDNAYGSFEQPYSIGQSVRLRHSDIITSGNTSPDKASIYDYNVTVEKVLTGETAKLFIKENYTNFDEEEFLFEDNDVYLARVYIEYNDESEISNHKPVDIFLSAVDSEGNYVATENRLSFSNYKYRTENSSVRNWYPVFVPKGMDVKLAFVIGSQFEAPGAVAAVHFNTNSGKTDIVDSSQFVESSAAAYYNLLYSDNSSLSEAIKQITKQTDDKTLLRNEVSVSLGKIKELLPDTFSEALKEYMAAKLFYYSVGLVLNDEYGQITSSDFVVAEQKEVNGYLVCKVNCTVYYRTAKHGSDAFSASKAGEQLQIVVKNTENPVVIDCYNAGKTSSFDMSIRTYGLDLYESKNWLDKTDKNTLSKKLTDLCVKSFEAFVLLQQ